MKTINVLIFSMFITASAYAQIPTNGLVGHWSFNDGNANDEAGTANGSVNGAVLAADRFSNQNKAYSFDGSDDLINSGTDTVLESLNTAFTLSVWFKKAATNSQIECLVCKWGYSPNRDHFLIGTSTNGLVYGVSGPADGGVFDTTSYLLNEWNHAVLSWDSSGMHKLYLNGTLLRADDLNSHVISLSEPVDLIFGAQSPGIRHLNGEADDIRIYNRVLSDSEVNSLFNEANPVATAVSMIDQSDKSYNFFPNPSSGLISFSADQIVENIEIISLSGQLLRSLNPMSEKGQFEADLENGLYLLRSKLADGTVQTDKIMISK